MKFDLKLENLWIVLTWLLVFMLVLSWDQEKIVVINLILFIYFLYYMVGETINNTLTQRQVTLLDALLVELVAQVSTLNELLITVYGSLTNYNKIFLTVFNKLFSKLQVILLEGTTIPNLLQHSNISNCFATVNFNLHNILEESKLLTSYKNIITSDLIIVEGQAELLLSAGMDL